MIGRDGLVGRMPAVVTCGGALLLAFLAAGGGGRDPRAALLWQLGACALLAAMTTLVPDGALRASRRALALLGVVVLLSALQADRVEAALVQGLAWTLAIVPAMALVAGGRRWSPVRGEQAVATASGIFLGIQAAGVLGWPLLGTAGATPADRMLGTFMDPNHLAAILCLIAAIHAPRAGPGPGRLPLVLTAVAAALALSTRSRVAVLAVGALLLAEAWRRRPRGAWSPRSRALAATLLGLILLAGALIAWSRRGDAEAWSRTHIWAGAARALDDRPLLGLGPAGFQSEWHRYQQPVARGLTRFERIAKTPHGEWLRLPIELGLAGVAALALLAWALRRDARRDAALALPVLAATAAIVMAHDSLHAPAFTGWLACGLALPLMRRVPEAGTATARPLAAGGRRLATAIGLALLAAWVVRVQASERLREDAFATRDASLLRRSLVLEPRDVDALLLASELAQAAGDRGALTALGLAEDAERLAPRDAEAALRRARALARLARAGDPAAAVLRLRAAYERAGDLAPGDAWRRAEGAAVLATVGDAEAALDMARKALTIEPHLALGRAWTIVALQGLGRDAEAEAERRLLLADLSLDPATLSAAERHVLHLDDALAEAAGIRGR